MQAVINWLAGAVRQLQRRVGAIEECVGDLVKHPEASTGTEREELKADLEELREAMNDLVREADVSEALKKHDTMVDSKVDAVIMTVRDMASSLQPDVDARFCGVDDVLATIRHDIDAVKTNLEETKIANTGRDMVSSLPPDVDERIMSLERAIGCKDPPIAERIKGVERYVDYEIDKVNAMMEENVRAVVKEIMVSKRTPEKPATTPVTASSWAVPAIADADPQIRNHVRQPIMQMMKQGANQRRRTVAMYRANAEAAAREDPNWGPTALKIAAYLEAWLAANG